MNAYQNKAISRIVILLVMAHPFWCPGADKDELGNIIIRASVGTVEMQLPGNTEWVLVAVNQVLKPGWRLRTREHSRVTLMLSDHSVIPLGALTEIEILAPEGRGESSGLNIIKGLLSFFHRDEPGRIRIRTRGGTAGVEGTEFVLEVLSKNGEEFTRLSVIDGTVQFSNEVRSITVTNRQQAVAALGVAPKVTAGFVANNVMQWALYYPAVLDLRDLPLASEERERLRDSLHAYAQGDLLAALAAYPGVPVSEAERVYYAALLLCVGQVAEAEGMLEGLSTDQAQGRLGRLGNALRTLIAAVKLQPRPEAAEPELSTEFLAASYYEQSRATGDPALRAALAMAQEATRRSADFGFAYARVAELELSFGRREQAKEALRWARSFTPRNAQALAMEGFILASENRTGEAIEFFDQALAVDAALGNAWLGRGLSRIRRGDKEGGREDLLMAAAMEPQRSLLRSYLGKAFSDAGETVLANKELVHAIRLDPRDPTGWLYSALLKQHENRINEAIQDLEKSKRLNDNRALFRSRMLLDQDQAVRGANLAGIYRDAGMVDVSVREATRAVNYDYGNYSAHLFLANSYNELRDPQQINLRYETPWLSEYLIANLLAPVGAGTLSQNVSQQEYSKLFERNRFGMASSTEYLSRGDWLQAGSIFGNSGKFGFAVDTYYLSQNGQRPNNDQEQLTLSLQLKYDFTPQDSVFFQGIYYDASAGDLSQYYDRGNAHLGLRTKEKQEPLLLAGYRHEWSPGVQTFVLVGRFDDDFTVADTNQAVLLLAKDGAGQVIAVPTPTLPTASLDYRSQLEIYSAEVQQILQRENHTVVLGARYQAGRFDTDSALGASTPTQLASMTSTTALSFATSPISQSGRTDFERISGYGYYYWRVFDPMQLSAGLSYDHLSFPDNHRLPPISAAEDSVDQVSPKAGFTYTPTDTTVMRFAYTRSLGGVSFDQSVRLEPSQVAGFNQAFRSLIPEAIAGSTAGAKFETFGLSLEQEFKTRTYLGIEGQLLNSDVNRTIGAVDLNFPPTYVASSTRQTLDYEEKNLIITLNQLLGDAWSLGARYRLSHAELGTNYPDIPDTVTSANHIEEDALLHQLSLFALFNHRCGFFARAEGSWYSQANGGASFALEDDAFWQVNLFAGYRFWRRHAQAEIGVLNLTDQDYRLNPLNLYRELPRERTFVASLQFNF